MTLQRHDFGEVEETKRLLEEQFGKFVLYVQERGEKMTMRTKNLIEKRSSLTEKR